MLAKQLLTQALAVELDDDLQVRQAGTPAAMSKHLSTPVDIAMAAMPWSPLCHLPPAGNDRPFANLMPVLNPLPHRAVWRIFCVLGLAAGLGSAAGAAQTPAP